MSIKEEKKLRVGFIHPDLGIGGAERLVVDAAVALQKRGHEVVMFTSRHDHSRCFEETRDGTLPIHVLGSSLPQRLHPKIPLTIVFSILRSLLLTLLIITSTWLPEPAGFFNPLSKLAPFDVFFVDQQSVCVPFLRFFLGVRVVFYCHFPDKLLSGGWEIDVDSKGHGDVKRGQTGLLKRLYRWPVDKLEEWTTGQSDVILSNSIFSSRVYARAFPSLAGRPPKVVYPCIDTSLYQSSSRKGKSRADPGVSLIESERPTIISLNRFEDKKNILLGLEAFNEYLASEFDQTHDRSPINLQHRKADRNANVNDTLRARPRLIIAGGYDDYLPDNVETLNFLRLKADMFSLSSYTITNTHPLPLPSDIPPVDVLFLLNFTTAQRTHLLTSPSTRALLYTPANEHFGIVPIEAMACGVPVIAADSGGPTESIVDLGLDVELDVNSDHSGHMDDVLSTCNPNGTGLLCPPVPKYWRNALIFSMSLDEQTRKRVSQAGKQRVRDMFSADKLGKEIEEACKEAIGTGDLHGQLGDKLIWGGAGLMLFAVANLGLMVVFNGLRG